jgi:hypothetical protein
MREEWTHDDGDHPSRAGYRRLGELAFRWPFVLTDDDAGEITL